MANPWFRLYHEFAHDPKVQMMSEADQRRLVMVFCLRCTETLATLKDEEIAYHLKVKVQELAKSKALFVRKGFIDNDWNVLNWDDRQFMDSSTGRTRRYRERKKVSQGTSQETPQASQVTIGDDPEQSRADTEQIQSRAEQTQNQSGGAKPETSVNLPNVPQEPEKGAPRCPISSPQTIQQPSVPPKMPPLVLDKDGWLAGRNCDEDIDKLIACLPKYRLDAATRTAALDAIQREAEARQCSRWEAACYLAAQAQGYDAAVKQWPAHQQQYIEWGEGWFRNETYKQELKWRKYDAAAAAASGAYEMLRLLQHEAESGSNHSGGDGPASGSGTNPEPDNGGGVLQPPARPNQRAAYPRVGRRSPYS